MPFAAELLARLERIAAVMSMPRVVALHLPPVSAATSKGGEFCALELDDGSIGLSYVMLDDTFARLVEVSPSVGLKGADALALARQYVHGAGPMRTLGFAAVNALTRAFFNRAGYRPPASTDSIGGLDPRPGEHIGMIGLFRPLVGTVTAAGARLTVLELREELVAEQAGFRVSLNPDDIADCSKVLSTSTILLNDTLDAVLAACRAAERMVLVGPTAGCLPDPLFERGVTLVGGTWIEDRQRFVSCFVAGESWSGCASKFAHSADVYPGMESLLARVTQ